MEKTLKNFWEWLRGLSYKNRCPNCGGSFLKKGKGGLVTLEEYVKETGETYLVGIGLCLDCLEQPSSLDIVKIEHTLLRWDYDEDIIEYAIRAVKRFKKRETTSYIPCIPKATD